MVELDRKRLRQDGETQPREKLDKKHIEDLVRDWKKGAQFESALAYYDGQDYWLTDGYHRNAALEELGEAKFSSKSAVERLRMLSGIATQ
ncbi:MAG: hypothetical protein HC773_00305 [Scytonema sp. CRU_2_7]|nr:hypothetical protein [Scytonema sp. CRU_2_7]